MYSNPYLRASLIDTTRPPMGIGNGPNQCNVNVKHKSQNINNPKRHTNIVKNIVELFLYYIVFSLFQ